jgi:hypothetical protein
MAPRAQQSIGAGSSDTRVRPLLLEKDEGELRTRRIHTDKSSPASSQFMLKVSPKNNGSQHLVAGSEVLAPGAALPRHRHLIQDEVLLIQSARPAYRSAIPSASCRSACVYPGQHLGKWKERRRRADRPHVHLLGAGVRGNDAWRRVRRDRTARVEPSTPRHCLIRGERD